MMPRSCPVRARLLPPLLTNVVAAGSACQWFADRGTPEQFLCMGRGVAEAVAAAAANSVVLDVAVTVVLAMAAKVNPFDCFILFALAQAPPVSAQSHANAAAA